MTTLDWLLLRGALALGQDRCWQSRPFPPEAVSPATHFRRRLVEPQSLEGRLPDKVIRGPAGELDLRHEDGINPVDVARAKWRVNAREGAVACARAS